MKKIESDDQYYMLLIPIETPTFIRLLEDVQSFSITIHGDELLSKSRAARPIYAPAAYRCFN